MGFVGTIIFQVLFKFGDTTGVQKYTLNFELFFFFFRTWDLSVLQEL